MSIFSALIYEPLSFYLEIVAKFKRICYFLICLQCSLLAYKYTGVGKILRKINAWFVHSMILHKHGDRHFQPLRACAKLLNGYKQLLIVTENVTVPDDSLT